MEGTRPNGPGKADSTWITGDPVSALVTTLATSESASCARRAQEHDAKSQESLIGDGLGHPKRLTAKASNTVQGKANTQPILQIV